MFWKQVELFMPELPKELAASEDVQKAYLGGLRVRKNKKQGGGNNMQVSDIMTPKVITINETQSLLEVRELMANNNLRRVPVVNDIGVLKGIIH